MRRLETALALSVTMLVACGAEETAPPLSRVAANASPGASTTSATTAEPPSPPRRTTLVAIQPEAWVHQAANIDSTKVGYIAPGGKVVSATGQRTAGPGCRGGFYAVEGGHVCADAVTVDAAHPVATLFSRQPEMTGLPYLYARSRYPTPVRYARFPTRAEQREHEPDLRKHLKAHDQRVERGAVDLPEPEEAVPLLTTGRPLPALEGADRSGVLKLGRARRRSGFALLATYVHEGRHFGLTRELSLIPLDRTRLVKASALRGAELGDDAELPVAIVTSKRARRYRLEGNKLVRDDRIPRYGVFELTGDEREGGGRNYLETRDGEWVREKQVRVIEGFRNAPVWAERGDKWIDISILQQTLVAYEGTKPVFATLVSTGADGIASHEKTHATIVGTFLIHTKHVTTDMDSDVKGESFDLRDVPFVQYFTKGYALHGAYWHDDFGRPRSHGCVNLSPHDAAWLFGWTSPSLPEGWHGALSSQGTLVHIHP